MVDDARRSEVLSPEALTSEEIHTALDALLERRDPGASGTVLGAGSDDLIVGRRFLETLVGGGWMVPTWPVRHGGRLSLIHI